MLLASAQSLALSKPTCQRYHRRRRGHSLEWRATLVQPAIHRQGFATSVLVEDTNLSYYLVCGPIMDLMGLLVKTRSTMKPVPILIRIAETSRQYIDIGWSRWWW